MRMAPNARCLTVIASQHVENMQGAFRIGFLSRPLLLAILGLQRINVGGPSEESVRTFLQHKTIPNSVSLFVQSLWLPGDPMSAVYPVSPTS